MKRISERAYQALSGILFVLIFASAVLLGTKIAYGATNPVYHVEGTFSSAGQGLLSGSDVKIHGVNIGKVSTIKLIDGQARIRLTIKKDETIPVASQAVIRPKTLFGEKFVDIDPGSAEATGPYLRDGDVIKDTLGSFEVERVLTDLYPVLKEIKPADLGIILDTLARGGEGLGTNVNDTLHNLSVFATGQAGNVAETQRFIDDMAALSDTLANHADQVVKGARDAHAALPQINARADEFTALLHSTSRLSGDLADVLEHNTGLLNKFVPNNKRVLDAVSAQKQRLPAVVVALRQFFETLAEAGTGIPYGDGALAKIKFIAGSDCSPSVSDCSGDLPDGFTADPAQPRSARLPSLLGQLRTPSSGSAAVRDLVAGVVG